MSKLSFDDVEKTVVDKRLDNFDFIQTHMILQRLYPERYNRDFPRYISKPNMALVAISPVRFAFPSELNSADGRYRNMYRLTAGS